MSINVLSDPVHQKLTIETQAEFECYKIMTSVPYNPLLIFTDRGHDLHDVIITSFPLSVHFINVMFICLQRPSLHDYYFPGSPLLDYPRE